MVSACTVGGAACRQRTTRKAHRQVYSLTEAHRISYHPFSSSTHLARNPHQTLFFPRPQLASHANFLPNSPHYLNLLASRSDSSRHRISSSRTILRKHQPSVIHLLPLLPSSPLLFPPPSSFPPSLILLPTLNIPSLICPSLLPILFHPLHHHHTPSSTPKPPSKKGLTYQAP